MHPLDRDCECDIEGTALEFLVHLLLSQTTPEYSSQAQEGVALASGAFFTPAIADDLTVEAEDRTAERKDFCFLLVPCSDQNRHEFLGKKSLYVD
jgi:hypothetical protein